MHRPFVSTFNDFSLLVILQLELQWW